MISGYCRGPSAMITAQEIIDYFKMEPLSDEGGFYVETWRASEQIARTSLPPRYDGPRNFGTAILYLLTADSYSRLHKVRSDEIFHFHLGDPVSMVQFLEDCRTRTLTLGSDILKNQSPQVIVPAGSWQGSFVIPPGQFALMSCTVAPGFDFADYQSADRDQLLSRYPDQADLIRRLT